MDGKGGETGGTAVTEASSQVTDGSRAHSTSRAWALWAVGGRETPFSLGRKV